MHRIGVRRGYGVIRGGITGGRYFVHLRGYSVVECNMGLEVVGIFLLWCKSFYYGRVGEEVFVRLSGKICFCE